MVGEGWRRAKLKGKDICPKDCPRRSAECHATCEEYLAFVKQNEEERAERLRKAQANSMMADVRVKRAQRIQRNLRKDMKIKRWG